MWSPPRSNETAAAGAQGPRAAENAFPLISDRTSPCCQGGGRTGRAVAGGSGTFVLGSPGAGRWGPMWGCLGLCTWPSPSVRTVVGRACPAPSASTWWPALLGTLPWVFGALQREGPFLAIAVDDVKNSARLQAPSPASAGSSASAPLRTSDLFSDSGGPCSPQPLTARQGHTQGQSPQCGHVRRRSPLSMAMTVISEGGASSRLGRVCRPGGLSWESVGSHGRPGLGV